MGITLTHEEAEAAEQPTVKLPTFDEILLTLRMIGAVIGARLALNIGIVSAAVLTGFIVTARNPAPNSVVGLGLFLALIAVFILRQPKP